MVIITKKQKFFIVLLLIIVLLLMITALLLTKKTSSVETDLIAVSKVLSQATFTDLSGNPVPFEGIDTMKFKLFYLWASWSPTAQADLTQLQTLATRFEDSFMVYAVNRSESALVANRFLGTLPDLSPLTIIIDENYELYRHFAGYSMPQFVLYDYNGNIVLHSQIELPFEKLSDLLTENR